MGKSDKYYFQSRPAEDDDDLDIDPNELTYSLEIVQQPIRARMCGFGDKDRRNVTPAPVLKLVAKTPEGRIVSASHLSKQAFVVTADLWLEDEVTERNLVLISSIPSSRTAAYSQQHQASLTQESQQDQLDILQGSTLSTRDAAEESDSYASISSAATAASSSNVSRMSIRNVIHDEDVSLISSSSATWSRPIRALARAPPSQRNRANAEDPCQDEQEDDVSENATGDAEIDDEQEYHQDNDKYVEQDLLELRELERIANESGRKEMSTRNLVGQIAVSGQIAPGLDDDMSHIWFAFSILSIRTEGFFKIRFCLSDLMRIPDGGKSEAICQVFTNTIHVQTPKKFEGTCDNNKIAIHLNKNCIRIPARKDEKKLNKNRKSSLS
ncbi:hypothetical protein BGZ58_010291 [Dissophora ornata]|nr:hypothetical protein BGZ58_010291 [Dissophora ornata]